MVRSIYIMKMRGSKISSSIKVLDIPDDAMGSRSSRPIRKSAGGPILMTKCWVVLADEEGSPVCNKMGGIWKYGTSSTPRRGCWQSSPQRRRSGHLSADLWPLSGAGERISHYNLAPLPWRRRHLLRWSFRGHQEKDLCRTMPRQS